MRYLGYYLLGINGLVFLIYGLDKFNAKNKLIRISERWLFFLATLGGALGALFGMFVFRHKTKKIKFYFWNIINLGIWLIILFRFFISS